MSSDHLFDCFLEMIQRELTHEPQSTFLKYQKRRGFFFIIEFFSCVQNCSITPDRNHKVKFLRMLFFFKFNNVTIFVFLMDFLGCPIIKKVKYSLSQILHFPNNIPHNRKCFLILQNSPNNQNIKSELLLLFLTDCVLYLFFCINMLMIMHEFMTK